MEPENSWPRAPRELVPGLWQPQFVIWPRVTINNTIIMPFSTGFRRNIYSIAYSQKTEWITSKEYIYSKLKGNSNGLAEFCEQITQVQRK